MTASPVTEYGSVTAKFQDKCHSGGTNSPSRSKLLIKKRSKPTQPSSPNAPVPDKDLREDSLISKHFGSRDIFFLLLSVSIHNLFEGKTNKV